MEEVQDAVRDIDAPAHDSGAEQGTTAPSDTPSTPQGDGDSGDPSSDPSSDSGDCQRRPRLG